MPHYLVANTPPSPDTLPKGNMWSAIPVALLSMFVTVGDGKQGSGPKGDDVLWNTGAFIRLFVEAGI